jgi:hypothetical protein
MVIATEELAIPTELGYLEGPTAVEGVYWRRCLRRRDADADPRSHAEDDAEDVEEAVNQWILYYRLSAYLDHEECCNGSPPCFRVETILHNTQVAAE